MTCSLSGKRDSSPQTRAIAISFRSPLSRPCRQLPRGAGRSFFVPFETKKKQAINDLLPERKTRLEPADAGNRDLLS